MEDCLFCKIAAGDIPSNKLYEDDKLLAFYDIDPQAPVHFLVIPKQHIASAAALTEDDAALLGHIYAVIAQLCKKLGVDESGYRVVTNVGADGCTSMCWQSAALHGLRADAGRCKHTREIIKRGKPTWQRPIHCILQA